MGEAVYLCCAQGQGQGQGHPCSCCDSYTSLSFVVKISHAVTKKLTGAGLLRGVSQEPYKITTPTQTPTKMIDPAREYSITANEQAHYTQSTKALKFPTAEAERDWARTKTKPCSKCHEVLPLSYFNGNTSGADPFDRDGYRLRRPECRSCTRSAAAGKAAAAAAAKRHGVPLKAPAGTPCELCGDTKSIVFDHDHETDTFRGWLCNACNRSIGVLGDGVPGLMKALNYLIRTQAVKPTLTVTASGQLALEEGE